MAVISINPVRPDPADRQPQDPRGAFEKQMDKAFKALNIANAGMGIAVNYQRFQEIRENRDLAEARRPEILKQDEATRKGTEATTLGREATTAETVKRTEALPTGDEARKVREDEVNQLTVDRKQQLFKDFSSNPRHRKLFDNLDNASKAYSVLVDPKNASQLQVSAAQRMLIRSIEPGIINAADLEAYSPDASAAKRMERTLSLQVKGTPLKLDAQAFKDFAGFLQNKAADDLRQAGAAYANSPQGVEFGATADVMQQVLRVEDLVGKADTSQKKLVLPPGKEGVLKTLMEAGMGEQEAIKEIQMEMSKGKR